MTKNIFKRMISVGIVFIMFGIIDNVIMIVFGNAIENFFGKIFHLSLMESTGLGNTVSDIIAIVCGRSIERIMYKLIPIDQNIKLSRFQSVFSEAVGITIGCLLGMFPLLFIEH